MSSIMLAALAATLFCFVVARFVLNWLVPLIPIDVARKTLAEPSASSLLTAMVAVAAGLAAMNAALDDVSISKAFVQPDKIDPLHTRAAAGETGSNAIARLAAFVRKAERHAPPPMTPFPADHQTEGLADVETMIARLAARLEGDSGDADGWRTLGWAHFATNNYAAAAKAYDRAVELRPDDNELKQAAAEARTRAAAMAAPTGAGQHAPGIAQN